MPVRFFQWIIHFNHMLISLHSTTAVIGLMKYKQDRVFFLLLHNNSVVLLDRYVPQNCLGKCDYRSYLMLDENGHSVVKHLHFSLGVNLFIVLQFVVFVFCWLDKLVLLRSNDSNQELYLN